MTAGMLVLLVLWYGTLAITLVLFRKDVGRYPGARFVFGITDLWALSLGLSPLLFALSYMIRNNEPAALLVALVGIPFGIAGAYMAILKNSVEPNLPRWKLFLTTVVGTLLGTYLLPAVTLLVMIFFGLAIAAIVVAFPWSLIIPLAVVVLGKIARKNSNAPSGAKKSTSIVAEAPHDRSRDA
jgi:hypothetical protein